MSDVPEGYKKTEVGVIPGDWEVKKLGDLVDKFVNGGTPSTQVSDYWKGEIPWITGADILNQKVSVIRRYISREAVKNSSTNIIEKNTLLLVSRTGVGKLAIAPFDVAISQDFTGIYTKKSELDTGYLFRYLDFVQKELTKQNQGTSIQGITRETLASIPIPLPPTRAEQTAIATALNDVDALITEFEKLIAKKRNIKQGAMQQLLKPKEGWEVKKLGEVATLKARIGWQGLTTAEYRKSGDYFLITGTEFKNGFIDWENCFYVEDERYKQDKNIQIKEHDVLVTKDGTIGKVAIIKSIPKPATLNSGVFVIRPINNSFVPEFFYYILLSEIFLKFLSQLSAGSTINHLYQKDFVSFQFLTPKTIEEQKRNAQILSDMDSEIEALEKKLDKYKMIKQGMMQNLLTGKIRLTTENKA